MVSTSNQNSKHSKKNNKNQTHKKGEKFVFSADIKKLLGLIINRFYKNKEVFLRETISNSSDAIDKIKFKALVDPKVLKGNSDFKIELVADSDAKTLTIRDNGIGMTRDEMVKNLGSIATSGTKNFMDAIKAGADIQMIGQFGVGFYSVFLVADRVLVRSKNNDDDQHVWISDAGGDFEIYNDSDNPNQLGRGTELVLFLKDKEEEFLEERRLTEIVKKHSEFVGHKINLWTRKEVEKEVTDDEADDKKDENDVKKDKIEEITDKENKIDEKSDKKDDKDVKIEEVKDDDESNKKTKTKKKKITEIKEEWEQLNKSKPIWAMKPEDVKPEEYNAFYKNISNDWEDPLAYKHFKVEGQVEFTAIIFIPKRAPFDLFNSSKKMKNIKLYVRKVFINDDAKDLCPEYLSFVKGVVDSEEMPLNISRETLQQSKIHKIISKNIVKKSLELIGELIEDKDKFEPFYKSFSKNLKYGVHEDAENRAKLASFMRFFTTKSEKTPKTLDEYIEGMQENQKDIYYITGESQASVSKLPFVELPRKKGLEVLYMTEPIDEYFVQQMTEFKGKKLVSVTKEGLELPMTDVEKKLLESNKKEFEPLCVRMKEILGNKVEKVEVSSIMTNSPCSISTSRFGWSSRMDQIMKNQALRDTTFSEHMSPKKILGLNPENSIIKELNKRFKENTNDTISKNLVFLVYETAILTSGGFTLQNPVEYAERIFKLTRLGLNIVEEEQNEEVPQLEQVNGKKDKDKDDKGEENDKNETMEEVD